MKKTFYFHSRLVTIATAVLAIGISSASAQVLVNDTTGFTNWYKGSNGGTLTKGVSNLTWVAPADTDSPGQSIGRSFTNTTLGIGETMTFSFDWVQSAASVNIIRVGIFDVSAPKSPIAADNWNNNTIAGSYGGYYTFVRDNSSSGNIPREDAAAFGPTLANMMTGGTNLNPGTTTQFDLSNNGTITYSVSFAVTRDTATEISTNFLIMDGVTERFNISATDSTSSFTTFNFAGIRSSGGTMALDNLNVTVIPEPAIGLLLGLGLLGLVAARRNRRK